MIASPFETNMENTTAELPTTVPMPLPYACDKCERSFDTLTKLSMHKVRLHHPSRFAAERKRQLTRNNSIKRMRQQAAERAEKQRRYNAAYRERNKAKGLTAAGTPRKPRSPSSKRLEYVWPLPGQPGHDRIIGSNEATAQRPTFCPHCGEDLRTWSKQT